MDDGASFTQPNAELAALIGSRICHDLISPIGAIGNGLELMDFGGSGSPELDLIRDICASAQARVRFFRVAFGTGGAAQSVSARDAAAILSDYAAGGRHIPDWQVQGDLPRCELQLGCLAYFCLETALPQGGPIRLARGEGRWQLAAKSERIVIDQALWARLGSADPVPAFTAAQVQFALLPLLADQAGRRVEAETGFGSLRLIV